MPRMGAGLGMVTGWGGDVVGGGPDDECVGERTKLVGWDGRVSPTFVLCTKCSVTHPRTGSLRMCHVGMVGRRGITLDGLIRKPAPRSGKGGRHDGGMRRGRVNNESRRRIVIRSSRRGRAFVPEEYHSK